jgi:hypothetical protein
MEKSEAGDDKSRELFNALRSCLNDDEWLPPFFFKIPKVESLGIFYAVTEFLGLNLMNSGTIKR